MFNTLWKSEKLALAVVGAQHTAKGYLMEVNTGFGFLLEYGTGELRGEPVIRLISQEDQLGWMAELQRLIDGEIDKLYQIVRFVQRGNKHYVTCYCWAWRLLDAKQQVTAILLHIRPIPEHESEIVKKEHEVMLARLESMSHRIELAEGKWDAFAAAHSGDKDVSITIGDRVGDNTSGSTRNDLGPFKWLVIGLVAIALGWMYAEYYRAGGKEPPKIPQLPLPIENEKQP